MNHEWVRTHYITVGRYWDLLGLDISLLDVQVSIRTAIASLMKVTRALSIIIIIVVIHYRV